MRAREASEPTGTFVRHGGAETSRVFTGRYSRRNPMMGELCAQRDTTMRHLRASAAPWRNEHRQCEQRRHRDETTRKQVLRVSATWHDDHEMRRHVARVSWHLEQELSEARS